MIEKLEIESKALEYCKSKNYVIPGDESKHYSLEAITAIDSYCEGYSQAVIDIKDMIKQFFEHKPVHPMFVNQFIELLEN